MTLPAFAPSHAEPPSWTPSLEDIPILWEDEEEEDMGEASYHVEADEIFRVCLEAHLQSYYPDLRVFANMNLYYKQDGPLHPVTRSLPYVSPDGMVVRPYQLLPRRVPSFTIGRDGPAPLLVAEILSKRSAQQRDLREKLAVYSKLAVTEYVLVDPARLYLPEQLLLKCLQPDGTWLDVKDPDGGITSKLGFRIVVDTDDEIRLIDLATGLPYPRPDEANMEAKARRVAEEYVKAAAEGRRQAELHAQAAVEARRHAELLRQAETDARRLAELHLQAETQSRLRAEQHAQTQGEARRQAEFHALTQTEARRQAEQQAQAETEARRQAELQVKAEAAARRQAEDNLRSLQDELDRLRRQIGET